MHVLLQKLDCVARSLGCVCNQTSNLNCLVSNECYYLIRFAPCLNNVWALCCSYTCIALSISTIEWYIDNCEHNPLHFFMNTSINVCKLLMQSEVWSIKEPKPVFHCHGSNPFHLGMALAAVAQILPSYTARLMCWSNAACVGGRTSIILLSLWQNNCLRASLTELSWLVLSYKTTVNLSRDLKCSLPTSIAVKGFS